MYPWSKYQRYLMQIISGVKKVLTTPIAWIVIGALALFIVPKFRS